MKINVALVTLSASTKPAGTINNSPSGLNVNRRKNDLIVSSWNILNDLGLTSLFSSLSVLGGEGKDILNTLCIHDLLATLYILHDLKKRNREKYNKYWWKIFILGWSQLKTNLSHDMRFQTMWYVWPAKAQTSLRIQSEPLLIAWIFYES